MASGIIAYIITLCITSLWTIYRNVLLMVLLCFLSHLCSQVVLLGDLNYRISLEEAETRSLVRAKNWAILLENDQVFFSSQRDIFSLHLNLFSECLILTLQCLSRHTIAAIVRVLEGSSF